MNAPRKSRTWTQTFARPALLAAITLAALVLGLVRDGVWDVVAVIGLAIPLVVGFRHAWKPGGR